MNFELPAIRVPVIIDTPPLISHQHQALHHYFKNKRSDHPLKLYIDLPYFQSRHHHDGSGCSPYKNGDCPTARDTIAAIEQRIQAALDADTLDAPFEQLESDEDNIVSEHPHYQSSVIYQPKAGQFEPLINEASALTNIPFNALSDSHTQQRQNDSGSSVDQKESERHNDETQPEAPASSSEQTLSGIVLTPFQKNLSEEKLLAIETVSRFSLRSCVSYPTMCFITLSSAISLCTTKSTKGYFLSVAAMTACLEGMRHAYNFSQTPKGYFYLHGGADSVWLGYAARFSQNKNECQTKYNAISGVDFADLYSELCSKFRATPDQYRAFMSAFFMGVMVAKSGYESTNSEATDPMDAERMRQYILRATRFILSRSATEKRPAPKPDSERPDELRFAESGNADEHFTEVDLTKVVLKRSTLHQDLADLENWYYLLSSSKSKGLLTVRRDHPTSPYSLYLPEKNTELFFSDVDQLARFFKPIIHDQFELQPLDMDTLHWSLNGRMNNKTTIEDDFSALGLDINNPPSVNDLESIYRRLARSVHPDRNVDDPDSHTKFTALTSSKIRIKNWLIERQEQ